jgi:outer membrane protein insertion porin family
LETPLPIGRLEIRPGGRISVQGRDFATSAGGLSYEGNWNPTLSLRAERRIRDTDRGVDYRVELVAEGPLDVVQPTFQAQGLSNTQAFSLVATGRTTSTSLNAGARVAGGAAASMLVGRISAPLGLDEVTVQPELLARETDPGARFTFGKQVTSALSFIYSIGLSGAEDRFLQLELRPWRSVSLKVQRSDDGTVTYGAGQRLTFGGALGPPAAGGEETVRLTEVRLEGDRPIGEELMRKRLESRVGKAATSWGIQEDADRLRHELVRRSFLEAEVGARLEGTVASFQVRSGRRFVWRVIGMTDPPDLGKELRKALFEEEAIDRGRSLLLGALRSRGHLRAQVTGKGRDEEGVRALVFEADPGPHLEAVVSFPGASALSEKSLRRAAGGAAAILTSPATAARGIQDAYRAVHRFDVTLEPPRVEEAGGRVAIRWPVSEGAPALVASVSFVGVSRTESELREAAALAPGAAFTDAAVSAAVERLRADYFARGFPKSRVSAEVTRQAKGVDVLFHVVEGDAVRVGRIDIAGLVHTREPVVRNRIPLKTGAPLDPRRLAATERRLMELGIFSRVNATASDGDPADVLVTVEEDVRVVASYDVRYNDQDQTTVQVDAETRNVAGVGLVVGGRYRVGHTVREARGSVFLPSVVKSGNLTGSVFHLEDDQQAVDPFTLEPFTNTTTQSGLQIQQKIPLSGHWDLLPGYRFKREHSTAFPDPIDIGGLDASLVRDTRDNPLDARRGRFVSFNLEYNPKALGSDLTFVKGFAQTFLTRPFGASWSWAQGLSLGLASGFGGQEVISTERFQAGGSNSLRGYATDSIGPRDALGQPKGGEAVVILNEELRYRHPSRLGFALFYDVGNVFETISAMTFSFRHDLGFGLRWESPVGLLRLDLGFPVNREPGEKSYQLFFNFGQAF